VACLAAAGLLAAVLLRGRSGLIGRAAAVLVLAAAISTGWAYAAWRAELRLSEALPGEWEGRDVVVTGVVASLPQDFERGLRFVFEVEESAAPLPPKISLAWYKGFRDEEMHSCRPSTRASAGA
jgi:competence protein ComEC